MTPRPVLEVDTSDGSDTADTTALFAARAAAVRRRQWVRRMTVLAGLLLIGLLTWLMAFSSVFAVQTVQVTGVPDATRAEVLTAASVPIGTPLARVDTDRLARQVEGLSTIASATVTRAWPRTVVIEATLKTPALALQNLQAQPEGSTYDVLAIDGSVIERRSDRPAGLPIAVAGTPEPTGEGIAAALAFLAILPAQERERVGQVRISGDSITATLGKLTVVWGDGSRPEAKYRVLAILRETKNVAVVDVSAPDSPVTRAR